MSAPDSGVRRDALADIDFDLEAVLERDSRVLLHPRFLATLHAELEQALGREDAPVALYQMGLLHGLQDAQRAVAAASATRRGALPHPVVPPLRMRCCRLAGHRSGAIEMGGLWPDAHEASARLSTLGASAGPVCHLSAGYTSGWLSGTLDTDLLAVEVACSAQGAPSCRFVAREPAAWAASRQRVALGLETLPLGFFRAVVRERAARDDAFAMGAPVAPDAFDRDAPLIHIWGPVMVIPFTGPDEALQAIELIGRDPGAGQVSVVVVDLAGAIVDDAFGALALEQVMQSIEAWGAEAIFAEPSSLCIDVVTGLDHPPLLIEKDLDSAIATAFRVAQAQRRLV